MSNVESGKKSSKAKTWTGYVMSALPVLFMVTSGTMKLVQPPMVVEGFAKNGISPGVIAIIGIVELLCVFVYLVPPTAVLGAVLMTGYLGGAVFVHVRAGEASLVAPILLGVMAWGGLHMRDERVRALLPLRKRIN